LEADGMITKVRIPHVDANIEEGTIGRWLKKEGEGVHKGDPLFELITDKAVFEIEAPASGTLRRIMAPPKSVLPVGYVVAIMGGAADALPAVDEENRALLEATRRAALRERKSRAGPRAGSVARGGKGPIRATPAARRLAREKGIDLQELRKTASGEIVTEEDVNQHIKARKP
jgi:pyruvate dehydrogenase E2 component (dihydrolipoamide acetyltransferase)